ncbi:MAG: tyrosine--tRNA ligase [Acidimicrobiales bacterium]
MTAPVDDLLADLDARGLIRDSTDRAALAKRIATGALTLYCGFDPTADSLHIGSLVPILSLRRFQLAGHRPIALAGGATGMIGDPSGKSAERNLLDAETLAANLVGISAQLERFLDFTPGPTQALIVDNNIWTTNLSLVDFLRDVGKHVTVNQMVAKDSVRSRMEGTEGISYTEFSYMLLQAYDYWWLSEHENCELQVGGSDQWGNITAGIDLIRRRSGRSAHGLTFPLVTRSDGAKYGKTADGTIWLSAGRTSPYRFYQYWMQVDDRDVMRFLMQLTLLSVSEAQAISVEHDGAPEKRLGQRTLAQQITTLVHGEEQARAAEAASQILFGAELDDVSESVIATLAGELETTTIARERLVDGIDLVDMLMETGLASSRGDARRGLDQGGVYMNNRRVDPAAGMLSKDDLLFGRYVLIRKGKRNYHLVQTTS